VPKPAAADNNKYLKGDGSWSALSNASAATNAEAAAGTSTTTFVTPANAGFAVAGKTNGLAPRQALVSDNTATTGATFTIPAFGTADFTVSVLARYPSGLGNSTIIGGELSYSFELSTDSTSSMRPYAFLKNVGPVLQATTAVASNRWTCISYTRASGIGTFYLDGVASGTGADASNYSNASKKFISDGLTAVYPLIYNRALSAAEVLALYQTGAPAGGDYNTASNTVSLSALLNGSFETNTASPPANWAHIGNQVATAVADATAPNGSNVVQIVASGAGTIGGNYMAPSSNPAFGGRGKRFRVAFWAKSISGSTVLSIGATQTTTDTIYSQTITASWAEYAFEHSVGSDAFNTIRVWLNGAGTVRLDNIRVFPLGLLLAPDSNNAGAGLEWLDVSGNRAHIVLPTAGVTWALPSSQQIVIEATTSTATNQQLGGASLIDANKQWRIQSWTVNCSTGTPTISLGNASAGAQYVSALVLAAGNNDITLLARFPATANLWASSSTTATLIHRIVLVPAN
jgi:hypothetical protein